MSISKDAAAVKLVAQNLYCQDPDWVTFYREVMGGILTIGTQYRICDVCSSDLLDDYTVFRALERSEDAEAYRAIRAAYGLPADAVEKFGEITLYGGEGK